MFVSFDGWTSILRKMAKTKMYLTNQNINIMYPNKTNAFMVPNQKMNRDYYKNPCLSYLTSELWFLRKWWKEKLFLQNQSVNIMYPNEKNVFMVPITKWMEIILRIHVCFIWLTNFNCKENGGKKSFSCEAKATISGVSMRTMYSWCLIMKKNGN